ncbi:S-layer homology domain-containing protein [Bacillus sp. FJAT-27231]|uniref:S-layer homology domain-containing protein n=1 Tax=Bacillus sp. FJAT-27231 TaxID=1679168 RepID=UPI000670FC11|nr:S-layer homology domain-containing protein [Bacillus sp. FJAT-27231]
MRKTVKWLAASLLSLALVVPSVGATSAAADQGSSQGTVTFDSNAKAANTATTASFSDVPKTFWAKDEIDYLVQRGIIAGYKNGKFGINDPIKRDHAAIILARALGVDKQTAPNPGFKDVPPSHPAYNEIAVLTKYGVFSKANYFNPNGKLKRSHMAKIITEGFGFDYSYLVTFKDVKSSDPFYKYITTLGSAGIAGGSNGYFMPNKILNRTEFSVFIARVFEPRFRTGVQVDIQSAQYLSDGRLKMNLMMYNNTRQTALNIKGKYALYIGDTLVAKSNEAREYKNISVGANQKKAVVFYFSASEIKNKVNLNELNNALLDYEHQWKYYK